MTDHTVKAFTEQLESLSALVAQMGGLAEAQFASAIEAIARRDSGAAEAAVQGDTRIDAIQQEIEDRALKLLALPREVGLHPESGKPITANFGRFGPYVAHDGMYASLETPEDVFTVGLNRAVDLIAEKKANPRARRGPQALKELGKDASGTEIKLMKGRYGPYVTDGSVNATVPDADNAEAITLEQALALIADRAAKGGGKKKKPARAPARPKKEAKAKKEPKAKAEKPAAAPKKKAPAKKRPEPVAGE